jgi:hypothetical protein
MKPQNKRMNRDGRLTAPDLLSLGCSPQYLVCLRDRVLAIGVFHLSALRHLTYMSFLSSRQVFLGIKVRQYSKLGTALFYLKQPPLWLQQSRSLGVSS